jgi:putative transposase
MSSGVSERKAEIFDLVDRNFKAKEPNQLWVADIIYVPTWSGFVFLAVVVDAFSRKVVGWSMANHLRTSPVLDALAMALGQREPSSGKTHHSGQGCHARVRAD